MTKNTLPLAYFRRQLETFRGNTINSGQWKVVKPAASDCLHVVAGPGTGKTTSLVSRILKLIFVDGLSPGSIVATTFTKKAAEELRSRILSQGIGLGNAIQNDKNAPKTIRNWVAGIDVNQVITGTLDSVCQNILREHKQPGAADPVPVDEYVASTLMFRDGLLFSGHAKNDDLKDFLLPLYGSSYQFSAGRKSRLIEEIYQRWHNDQVNFSKFRKTGSTSDQQAKQIIEQVITRYENRLQAIGGIDFVQLEAEVLRRFQAGELDEWRDRIQVVIVDEYQDTNLLQEQIYLEMASSCQAITVVGDDDQSLYRFRGATVELFVDFPARLKRFIGPNAKTFYLVDNYRSTQPIIDLVNGYADLDASYQRVRVPPPAGHKRRQVICQANTQPVFPVLGLFRGSPEKLAEDLALLIHDVFRGKGRKIPKVGKLIRAPADGDLGDCCLLGSSHREFTSSGRIRLPRLLRDELEKLRPRIEVFNPRGRSITDIEDIQIFGGYVAHVVDPGNFYMPDSGVGKYDADTSAIIQNWKDKADKHWSSARTSPDLKKYVQGWFDRQPAMGRKWPRRVSVLEFLNGLQHFFPEFHDDPEGQLYYEVFTRQFQACQQISSWEGDLVTNAAHPNWEARSTCDLIDFFIGPIASGAVGVNEELIESFPRNRLTIMSVHQAKGLEFPMVIVDIGSDFKRNQWTQARDRFPRDGESPHRLETQMRKFSTGLTSMKRSEQDRAFDDLYRKFFVALSRPEQVLVLVGLDKSRPDAGSIPNVAAGDDRKGNRRWPKNVPITYL